MRNILFNSDTEMHCRHLFDIKKKSLIWLLSSWTKENVPFKFNQIAYLHNYFNKSKLLMKISSKITKWFFLLGWGEGGWL